MSFYQRVCMLTICVIAVLLTLHTVDAICGCRPIHGTDHCTYFRVHGQTSGPSSRYVNFLRFMSVCGINAV